MSAVNDKSMFNCHENAVSRLLSRLAVAICLFLAATSLNGQAARQLRLEQIEFSGNSRTRPEVILEHLAMRPGDVIDPQVLEQNRRTLQQTNFFKSVDFFSRPGSQKGTIIVVVEVTERRWPYFQFEGGHTDMAGWYFVPASMRFDNLFGRGHRLSLRWLIGDEMSQAVLNFRLNSLFARSAFLDFDLHGTNQRFIHYTAGERATQKVEYGGLRLRLGGKQGWLRQAVLGYRSENFRPETFLTLLNPDRMISAQLLPGSVSDYLDETNVRAFSVGYYRDSRDNRTYPLRGFWGALTGELSRNAFGSDVDFAKLTWDMRFFQRFTRRNVLAFHVKGGFISDGSPFYERFYLGGANSLRGYPARRLTSPGWGTKMLLTNVEMRFPLSGRNFPYHRISGAIFFDAGGIWLPEQHIRADDLFGAFGLGIRIQLPVVGVTRIDFAFPLSRIDANDFQVHLSLGHMF
jgi:outer membrane protein insertion porin family